MGDARRTIPHSILRAARRWGAHVAIRSEDGRETSYAGLEPLIMRTAAAFMAAGVAKGDHVAIWAPNIPDWIVAAVGLQAAGGVLVPLNTRLKGREAAHILGASKARLLFTVEAFQGTDYPALLEAHRPATLKRIILFEAEDGAADGWDSFVAGGASVSDAEVAARLDTVGEDDVCDILFTSGTTGLPKGVVTTHGQNVRLYERYSQTLGLGPDDRYLIINPFFHSFGYKAGWLSALLRGTTILPQKLFNAAQVLGRIEAEQVTVMPGPPTLYQSLLAEDYRSRDLSSLRLAITGAASVPVRLIEEMRAELGIATVLTAYGLTESCGVVTMCNADDDSVTIATSAGQPLAGVEVRIADSEGGAVKPGEAGELLVRGDNVMRGYLDDPGATALAVDGEGWLRTGDIAVQDARGYVTITDRRSDVFIVGGFNAYPAEIERLMLEHPDILQAAVIGVPDARMGEVARAFVVLRPGATATVEDIVAWCRANMANYKVPRQLELRDALPLNASGKVQKFLLRQQ